MAPIAIGGGGVVGVVVLIIYLLAGGEGGAGLNLGEGGTELAAECQTGEDANQRDDCRIVAVVNSVQAYWTRNLEGYTEATTVFFTELTDTGCGTASSQVGPFYCPLDETIYIDLGFYDQLRTQFGANGGPFAEAYVIAHEYGHHVQNLLRLLEQAKPGEAGPQSKAVRIELMADCFAGRWAQGAVDTGFIEELTAEDIKDGLDAAAAVGDDRIQENLQGRVDPESWTHGSSESRQKWFLTGYEASNVNECDTLSASQV